MLARQEMLNGKLLQLEPSALRAPDGFDAPSRITPHGGHLPATLYRLSQQREGSWAEIAYRLSETCRSDTAGMQPIAKGKALTFLNPIPRKDDAAAATGETRVIDREDLQLEPPI